MPTPEPEITAPDGTVRKAHYGTGRQPWDDIMEAGWGAPFAAGNVLKYVRRAAAKNGEDDIAKARWYFKRLSEMAELGASVPSGGRAVTARIAHINLTRMLTQDELRCVHGDA